MSSQNGNVELNINDSEKEHDFTQDLVERPFCFGIAGFCDNLSVGKKVGGTMLGVLLVSIGFMFILTISQSITFRNDAVKTTSDALIAEEVAQLDRIRESLADYAEEYYKQMGFEAKYLSLSALELEEGGMYKNWRSTYNRLASSTPQNPINATSTWFVHENNVVLSDLTSMANTHPSIADHVKRTSVFDFFFINILRPVYALIYYGTEAEGIMRGYPWESSSYENMNFMQRDGNGNCVPSPSLADGMYEPRCRGWYIPSMDMIHSEARYSEPYEDAGTGDIIITVSSPVKRDATSTLHGVIGLDPKINTLRDVFTLEHGKAYAFMTDSQGNVVFHPDFSLDSDESKKIYDPSLEGSALASTSSFFTTSQGSTTYTKDDHTYYLSWEKIQENDYRIGVVIAEDYVIEAATATKKEINAKINGEIIAMCLVFVFIAVVAFFGSIQIAKMVTQPVKELTTVCRQISSGNLDVNLSQELDETKATCSDVLKIDNAFKHMLTSVRFGSEAYFSGDVEKAKRCFEDALSLFESVNNTRGIAISQNNLGSVYSNQKQFQKAHDAYAVAINLANEARRSAQNAEEKEKATITLSSRMGNRAVCYMQEGKLAEAEKLIREAMNYDTQVQNAMGFVIKSGTLATIFLKQNLLTHAETTIREAEQLLVDEETFTKAHGVTPEDFAISRNYAKINRAKLSLERGDLQQAWELCDQVLTNEQITTLGVQREAAAILTSIYEKLGAFDAINQISEVIQGSDSGLRDRNVGPKDVILAYDYSGSMSGGRHSTAIQCLKDIFTDHIKPDDRVALIHFNSRVSTDVVLKEKNGNTEEFQRMFRTLHSPSGGTAFFDALDEGLNQLNQHQSEKMREKWIIALTDGEDNSSKKKTHDIVARFQKENVAAFICVCVGVQKNVIDICGTMANATPNGKVIDANGDPDSIKEAFQVVEQMLEGHMVLEKY